MSGHLSIPHSEYAPYRREIMAYRGLPNISRNNKSRFPQTITTNITTVTATVVHPLSWIYAVRKREGIIIVIVFSLYAAEHALETKTGELYCCFVEYL